MSTYTNFRFGHPFFTVTPALVRIKLPLVEKRMTGHIKSIREKIPAPPSESARVLLGAIQT